RNGRIMKVVSIVGARPQFVKLAPVAAALSGAGHEHVIVHTGQHYDDRLSDVFFADLAIPQPAAHLGVGSGSHGVQTGTMLSALDGVLDAQRPDWVLVYGDTNSTLAGALSAVKLHLPVAHLEAGLRSLNRAMPEEHNRLLTDPRLVAKAEAFGVDLYRGRIVVAAPLPYPQTVAAVLGSRGVVTDSGGLQKEAFLLDRLCTTVRTETEWVETLEGGWNVLAGTPELLAQLPEFVTRPVPGGPSATPYGDGRAAPLVARTLAEWS